MNSVSWNDHSLAITWPNIDLEPLLSKKDNECKDSSEEAKDVSLKRDPHSAYQEPGGNWEKR